MKYMNNTYITLMLICSFFVSGCKSTYDDSKASESTNESKFIHTASSPNLNNSYPEWVFSPKLNGYYVVLGSAPKQNNSNYRAQLIVAITSARAELAKIKSTSVASTLDIERTSETPLDFESTTNLKSDVVFDVSKADIIKSWKHPETEELFILYGYKTK